MSNGELSFCCRRIRERDREEEAEGTFRLFSRICWKRRLYFRGCICVVNKIHEFFFFLRVASVWKYKTGDVCCVIVVLLCMTVFESLRI
jgi:hypothetical protein